MTNQANQANQTGRLISIAGAGTTSIWSIKPLVTISSKVNRSLLRKQIETKRRRLSKQSNLRLKVNRSAPKRLKRKLK